MVWRKRILIALGVLGGLFLLVIITQPLWAPRMMYLAMVSTLQGSRQHSLRSESYALPAARNGGVVAFEGLVVPTPPGKEIKEKISDLSVTKYYFDIATSTVFITKGMSSKDAISDRRGDMLMYKGLATNYERDQLIWSENAEDLTFWSASRDRIGDMVRLILKQTKYSPCLKLLEFENIYGIKGLACETYKPNSSTVSLYTKEDVPYQVWLFNIPNDVRDSIVAGIRQH